MIAHDRYTRALPVALTAALLATAGLVGCRGTTREKPPVHLNQNMDNVARFDPQEPNGFFPDNRAMRLPVPGTVAVGQLRQDRHLYEGMVDGVLVNALPAQIELSAELIERGQQRYNIYCVPCHGSTGYSDGVVVERGLLQPPSFHDERLRHEPLGHFYQVISNGIRNMPGYAAQIPVEDRWAIATYIRALQASQVASLD